MCRKGRLGEQKERATRVYKKSGRKELQRSYGVPRTNESCRKVLLYTRTVRKSVCVYIYIYYIYIYIYILAVIHRCVA